MLRDGHHRGGDGGEAAFESAADGVPLEFLPRARGGADDQRGAVAGAQHGRAGPADAVGRGRRADGVHARGVPRAEEALVSDAASTAGVRTFAPWASGWRATLLLVLSVTALRIVYLVWLCPYTLIEDEAHYWEWSRRLALSYYSKGPGVAWLIAASTRLFGDSEWAVRLPAALASGASALCVAGLARDACRDGRAGFFAAGVFLLMPVFQVVGLLMTIDGPMVACWAAACWAGWRAIERGSGPAWVALGAVLAVGFLFKYVVVLLVPGLAWYTLIRRGSSRPRAGWGWVAAGVSVGLLGVAPVAAWNAAHGWPTVHHLLGHLGLPGGDVAPTQAEGGGWRYNPKWTLEFLGGQIALAGAPLLLGVYSAVVAIRRRSEPAWPGRAFLIVCGAPVLAIYVAVSFLTEPEGNWPMAGYVTMAALCGWGVVDAMDDVLRRRTAWGALPRGERPWAGIVRRKPESHRQIAWDVSVVLGLVIGLGALRIDLLSKAPLVGWMFPQGRMGGADERAADAAQRLDALRERTGVEPFVIAQQYGRASQMAFYLPGRPTVYCASSLTEGRATQYDHWPETDLRNPEVERALLGRPALLTGATIEQWRPAFERVEPGPQLRGESKAGRLVFVGIGYRGFGAAARQGTEEGER
ncbi:MAG: hypothetical protein DPW19_07490 [cyanobacterium CYA1]|nr:hypothetical protein [cyanobacterium CYA1]